MTGTNKSARLCQSCGLCGVKIDSGNTVHFSFGKPGSRERLYARVCQHVSDRRCINSDADSLAPLTADDAYGQPDDATQKLDKAFAAVSAPIRR
ncbi:MAG: hypothetical protein WA885_06410 [Phormidesmis sp.]